MKLVEHRDIDPGAVHAPLLDADRASFQRARRRAVTTEAGQQAHQHRRFRRREAGFSKCPREAGTQRADYRATAGVGTGDELADRGLAVGAGDGDERQAFARRAIDGMRQRAGQRAQAGDREVRCGQRRIPGKIAARLPQYGNRPARNGIGNVAAPIGQVAGISEENITRLHLAAVVGNPGGLDAQRLQASEKLQHAAHSRPFRLSASAT